MSVNPPTKTFGQGAGYAADLQYWERTAREILARSTSSKIVVEKSTLPVRTAEAMERILNGNDKGLRFDVLSNPQRHPALDGSGFVRSVDHADRIQKVGDVFTMNMQGDHMGGEYKTDNHVSGYAKDKLLAWKTAPAGTEPPGWEWLWELEAQGPNETLVRHTYDWSKVTDKKLLEKVKFPLVTEDQLSDTLARLAAETSS